MTRPLDWAAFAAVLAGTALLVVVTVIIAASGVAALVAPACHP